MKRDDGTLSIYELLVYVSLEYLSFFAILEIDYFVIKGHFPAIYLKYILLLTIIICLIYTIRLYFTPKV